MGIEEDELNQGMIEERLSTMEQDPNLQQQINILPPTNTNPIETQQHELRSLIARTFSNSNYSRPHAPPNFSFSSSQNVQQLPMVNTNTTTSNEMGNMHNNIVTQEFNLNETLNMGMNNTNLEETEMGNDNDGNGNLSGLIMNTNANNANQGNPGLYGLEANDNKAIQNLVDLGFKYNQSLEAYLSCMKNEQ